MLTEERTVIRFFKEWRKKNKQKALFAFDYRLMVIRHAWGQAEGDFESDLRALESLHLQRGLTQRDLDKVKKSIGYVRIE